jgi:hypothetical protein
MKRCCIGLNAFFVSMSGLAASLAMPFIADAQDPEQVFLDGEISGTLEYTCKDVYVSGTITGNFSLTVHGGHIYVGTLECFPWPTIWAANGTSAVVDCSGTSAATAGDAGLSGYNVTLAAYASEGCSGGVGIEVAGVLDLGGQYGGQGGWGAPAVLCNSIPESCFFRYPQPGQQGGIGGNGGNVTITTDGYFSLGYAARIQSRGGDGGGGGAGGDINTYSVGTFVPGINSAAAGNGRDGGHGGTISITAGTTITIGSYAGILSAGGYGGSGGGGGSSGVSSTPGGAGGAGGAGAAITLSAPDTSGYSSQLDASGGGGGAGGFGGSGSGVSCYSDCGCGNNQSCDTAGPGENGGQGGASGNGGAISFTGSTSLTLSPMSVATNGGPGSTGGTAGPAGGTRTTVDGNCSSCDNVPWPGQQGRTGGVAGTITAYCGGSISLSNTSLYSTGGIGGWGGNAGSGSTNYCSHVGSPIPGGIGGSGGVGNSIYLSAGTSLGLSSCWIDICGGNHGAGGFGSDSTQAYNGAVGSSGSFSHSSSTFSPATFTYATCP